MNPEEEVKEILRAVKEYETVGFTAEGLLKMIDEIRPVETIYIEKELITTEKQREYMKGWRENRDRVSKIKDKHIAEQDKLDNCLKRTGFMCSKCGRVKISDPNTNTYQYVKKNNRTRTSIVIINKCPKCQRVIKLFGGYKVK